MFARRPHSRRGLIRRHGARPGLAVIGLVLGLGYGSCVPNPEAPPGAGQLAKLRLYLSQPAGIAGILVQVTAPDLPDTLFYNLAVVDSVASGTLTVPAGSNRTITVRAFDVAGIVTHMGSVVVNVRPTGNPTVTITLTPISGDQPIIALLGSLIVTVTPTSGTVELGDTMRLQATVMTATGDTTVRVQWATLNPTLATVDTAGLVTGVAKGYAQIVATFAGVGGSAKLLVLSYGGQTSATPWIADDFSTYTSTTNLLANPLAIYSSLEDVCGNGCLTHDSGTIWLDQTVGLNVAGYHLTQSMRYDQPAAPACGQGLSVGRNVVLPATTQDLWLELWVRFSEGWSTADPRATTCDPGYKYIFGRITGASDRWALGIETQNNTFLSSYPGEPDVNTYITFTGPVAPGVPYAGFSPQDGNWHRYRFYWSYSTATLKVWLDDRLALTQTGIAPTGTGLFGVALGRTMNSGPLSAQSIWWGLVQAFNTDPGW